jgi:integrase
MMQDKEEPGAPLDADVSTSLRAFDAARVEDAWNDARNHRLDNPRIALTAARELLESVCKHILDLSGTPYDDRADLPELYRLTARSLDLAPSQQSEETFRRIFGSCTSIVEGVGSLRNFFGSAHGRGSEDAHAAPRHAELAVNLAGVMAMYLVKTWSARQHTVGNLITEFLEELPPLSNDRAVSSSILTLRNMLQDPIANVLAPKLSKDDLVAWGMHRMSQGIKPRTAITYLNALSQVFIRAKSKLGLEAPLIAYRGAQELLREQGVNKQYDRVERRLAQDEYDRLMDFFKQQNLHRNTKFPMDVVMEFALETGFARREICALLWSDVQRDRTCKESISGRIVRLSDRAWALIQAQRPPNKKFVFPYNDKTVGQRFTKAAKKLHIKDLDFKDLRFEFLVRMFERNYAPHEVQSMVGVEDHAWFAYLFKKYGRTSPPDPSSRVI